MRLRRSPAELARQRRACELSRDAHVEAMRYARPGLYEYQVQAALEFVFRSQGSPRNAYPSIVASGPNACILHYVENTRQMQDGELLLIDAGCEWGYHAADITRTFPVNGRFTAPQRAIYAIVRRAQLAGLAAAPPGNREAARGGGEGEGPEDRPPDPEGVLGNRRPHRGRRADHRRRLGGAHRGHAEDRRRDRARLRRAAAPAALADRGDPTAPSRC